MEKMIKFLVQGSGKELYITKEFLEINYTQKGGYTGTAQEIDDRVVSALGKEDGKFPLTEAVKGNVYYFPGNKKFYICKEAQNRRVSVPDGNFEELSIWENRKRLENLFSFSNQSEINIIKFSNIAIVSGTFKNIEFNKSTDIIIPVTLKNVSVMATPWHTRTPGNLTIMSYGEKNKITIRANNNGTNLTTVSGTFIAIGTM